MCPAKIEVFHKDGSLSANGREIAHGTGTYYLRSMRTDGKFVIGDPTKVSSYSHVIFRLEELYIASIGSFPNETFIDRGKKRRIDANYSAPYANPVVLYDSSQEPVAKVTHISLNEFRRGVFVSNIKKVISY